ncbi:MAG TPA: hypothetical protein VHM90_14685 [Phycisphaerae bacterium]|nr:hypothetical protein [Phycisphaerae bacterium]
MADELTMLLELAEPLAAQRVKVEWDPAGIVLSKQAAIQIEEQWRLSLAEAKAAGRSLFNGAISRLISAGRDGQGNVALRLGPTDYKTFLVSCMLDGEWFAKMMPECVAAALGNSALLTQGDRALLGVRSQKVSAYPGRAHLFGGVLEVLGTEKFPASAAGLVAHLQLELQEEAGMGADDLSAEGPRVLGLAYDKVLHQPELFWQWETRIHLEDVARRINEEEHNGTVLVDRERVGELMGAPMTPVARYVVEKWAKGRLAE